MALYNSFKMARYLLIGPGLFWFLVAPTTEVSGIAWQLGGGQPRTVFAYSTQEESAEFAKKVALKSDKSVTDPEAKAKDPIKVSLFFNFYTETINKFVTEAENVILRSEDDEQLMFIARTQALEALASAQIESPELIEMFQGNLFNECQKMMQSSLRLSRADISPRTIQELEKEAAAAYANGETGAVTELKKTVEDIKKTRRHYKRIYEKSKLDYTKPNKATLFFMSRYQDKPGATQAVMTRFKDKNPAYAGKKVEQLGSSITLTCEDLWLINLQAIFVHAAKLEKVMNQKMPVNLEKDKVAQQKFCNTLARKISNESIPDTQRCDLVQTMGIYLIKNALQSSSLSRIAKHHQEAVQPILKPKKNTTLIINENGTKIEVAGGADNYQTSVVTEAGLKGETASVKILGADGGMHRFLNIDEVSDHMSASFTQHLNYQTQELKQSIFTIALNFPYYQGLLLYFLSIAYPFTCLLVLIPGRAVTFLSIPLFWLWIKSWNVAFAMVMVFDRVIWNIFPHSELPLTVCDKQMADCKYELPDLLAEAFKDDPLYHVHSYYYLLSLAIFSIPAITGYATLKGRRAILASFTGGVKDSASDVGEKAGGLYGLNRINKVNRDYKSFMGHAQALVGPRGSGFFGGGPENGGSMVDEFGNIVVSPNMYAEFLRGNNLSRGQHAMAVGALSTSPNAIGSGKALNITTGFTKATVNILDKSVSADAKKNSVFHPQLGSAGTAPGLSANASAEAGSMDGKGGMEIFPSMGDVSTAAGAEIEKRAEILKVTADAAGAALAKGSSLFGVPGGATAVGGGALYGLSQSENGSKEGDFFDDISDRPENTYKSFTDMTIDSHYTESSEEQKEEVVERFDYIKK